MRGKLIARPVQRLVGRVVASTRAICLRQAIELLTGDFRKYYSLKKLVAQRKQVLRLTPRLTGAPERLKVKDMLDARPVEPVVRLPVKVSDNHYRAYGCSSFSPAIIL